MTVKYLVLGTLFGAAGGAASVGLTFAMLAGMPMPEASGAPCVTDSPGQITCHRDTPPPEMVPDDPLPALSSYGYQPYTTPHHDIDSAPTRTLPDHVTRRFML